MAVGDNNRAVICAKGAVGLVLGFTLALGLSGIFAWVGYGGIGAPNKTQFIMWIIAPIWMITLSAVFAFTSTRQAVTWLGLANLFVYVVLSLVKSSGMPG